MSRSDRTSAILPVRLAPIRPLALRLRYDYQTPAPSEGLCRLSWLRPGALLLCRPTQSSFSASSFARPGGAIIFGSQEVHSALTPRHSTANTESLFRVIFVSSAVSLDRPSARHSPGLDSAPHSLRYSRIFCNRFSCAAESQRRSPRFRCRRLRGRLAGRTTFTHLGFLAASSSTPALGIVLIFMR